MFISYLWITICIDLFLHLPIFIYLFNNNIERKQKPFFHFDRNQETALAVAFLFTGGREKGSNAVTPVFSTKPSLSSWFFILIFAHAQNQNRNWNIELWFQYRILFPQFFKESPFSSKNTEQVWVFFLKMFQNPQVSVNVFWKCKMGTDIH